jgi:hypothetical protein
MKRIVYINDGALWVAKPNINTHTPDPVTGEMVPVPENITEDEAVARAIADVPETATDVRVLPESAIPAAREHRALWIYNADKTAVVVDQAAATAATAEKTRLAAVAASVTGDSALITLRRATPAAIDKYVDDNVTTLPEARAFLKRLTKLVVSQLPKQPT